MRKLIGSHLERNCVVAKRLLAPQELVEDDLGDVLMTAEAFEMSPLHSTLHVAGDSEPAIFIASPAETDIAASYQLHANAYITKPVSLDLFTEAIRQVDDFFLTLVKLPAED